MASMCYLFSLKKNIGSLRCSWHIFTGIGVYSFMVLVECLRSAQNTKEMNSAGLKLSSDGTWPFTVYLTDKVTRTSKAKNI
jgi:dihydroceramidase